MSGINGSMRLRAVILAVALVLAMTAVGFVGAEYPVPPLGVRPGRASRDSFAAGIPGAGADPIMDQGIVLQPSREDRPVVANLTLDRLKRLSVDGSALEERSRPFDRAPEMAVAIDSGNAALLGQCTKTSRPKLPQAVACDNKWDYKYINLYDCAYPGAKVTGIDFSIDFKSKQSLYEACPTSCYGQLEIQLGDYSQWTTLSTSNRVAHHHPGGRRQRLPNRDCICRYLDHH